MLNVADVEAAVVTAAKVNTLTLNAVSITGVSISGQTITGGLIRTAGSSHRVEISPQAYKDVRMPSGYPGAEYNPAALGAYYNSYDPDSPILTISGPDIGRGQASITISGAGTINLFPTNPSTPRVRALGALRLIQLRERRERGRHLDQLPSGRVARAGVAPARADLARARGAHGEAHRGRRKRLPPARPHRDVDGALRQCSGLRRLQPWRAPTAPCRAAFGCRRPVVWEWSMTTCIATR
ncbi:MAG TPA: hypothetical protein VFZ86_11870 [Thermoleophilia bacterium]|nr:hypothetical protein [Thermoleophilia bacterium]